MQTAETAIVLVRPQLGENIGAVARAMLNFGLTDLRLVNPRDGWPNPDAGPAASGADEVLRGARLFDSVDAAVADCGHVYATTVRPRGLSKRVVTPAEAAAETAGRPGRTAIMFGAEASGLNNDEVVRAQEILTVSVNPDFSSLNLAQAVILCAYEWSRHADLPRAEGLDAPASQSDVDGLVRQLDTALAERGYFNVADRTPATRRTLRNLFTRPGYTEQEVRTLRGIVATLTRRLI